MLSLVLGYAPGLPYEDGKVNITGTLLLASITSKTGKEFLVKHQLIPKAQKSTLNQSPWRVGRIVFGNGAYAGTLATLQAVVCLCFSNNIF